MIEENILKCLKKQDMTIEEVSKKININRSTASKYLLVLETKGFIKCREIGKANLFSIK